MLAVRGPNIRIPPAYFAAGFLVGMLLHSVLPIPFTAGNPVPRMLTTTGWILVWFGFGVSLSGVITFRLAGTTMFPFESASRLVRRGPYRFTRNPMYLGMTIVYVGFALVVNTAWPLLLLPLVLWGLVRGVIRVEEAYLEKEFGDDYRDFKKRVRRWL
jgi:protein-S-isoprenylcysteine O-methyltransferase Ste14